jgi:hypothetical protein
MTQKLNIEVYGENIVKDSSIIFESETVILIEIELSKKWVSINESNFNDYPILEIQWNYDGHLESLKELSKTMGLTFMDYQHWDIFSVSINYYTINLTLIKYNNESNEH